MTNRVRPLALIILDGWGYRIEQEFNAIAAAHKPFWDQLWEKYPHTLISGSGRCVGLPDGQMGNSEVGHLTMGAGRVIQQDLTRIDDAIANGELAKNPTLKHAAEAAIQQDKAIHIMGLLSSGGVHSHENHFHAVLSMLANLHAKKVYFHVFLDGRDTPPRSAHTSLQTLQQHCDQLGCGQIASLIGRYYAMDRDKRWDRVQQAYDLLTLGKADYHALDAISALEMAYARGENDEFVKATTINSYAQKPAVIEDGDAVIFMNFRADRARELTEALAFADFQGFQRKTWPQQIKMITFTEYEESFSLPIAFPPQRLNQILGEYLSNQGLKQLRIAETEKYAHVTFFFNGGIEQAMPGEDRILIPSPQVATYDLQPAMSAPALTDQLIDKILSQQYDVIICNFANPDMVGHSGNFAATVTAIETIDQCLSKIIPALLSVQGEALITADHGNAECMFDNHTGQPHTAHTSERVPLIYIGRNATVDKNHGVLADIAPTMLYLMGFTQPNEMTGQPIFQLINRDAESPCKS